MNNKTVSKIFAFASLAIVPFTSQAQGYDLPKSIKVRGSVQFVSPYTPNKVYLLKESMTGKPNVVDSVVVDEQNKNFSFVLNQDHPGIYRIDAFHWDQIAFWSDGDVNVNLRGYDTARMKMKIPHYSFVEGSMDNNFINLYEQISQLSYLRMIDEYNEEYSAKEHKEKDSAWITYLTTKKRYDSSRADFRQRKEVLLNVFKNRPVLLYALKENIGPENKERYRDAMAALDNLISRYPWLTEAKEAKEAITSNIEMASKIQAGQPVPSISYPDEKGKLQGLGKYKGKYLLMDFWASWCGPCRQAVPKVKELYAQYKKKGLEVVSISIDTDKNAWRKAMSEEKMPWEQLLSPNLEITMKQFQFSGIPTLFIIDPNGKIIDRFTGYSPDTEKEIKSILDTQKMAPKEKKMVPAMSF